MYWLIEERNGDQFETRLDAQTEAEAISEAQRIFDKLSDYDKKHREAAYVVLSDPMEDDDRYPASTEQMVFDILKGI